jgi:hypothetical protein
MQKTERKAFDLIGYRVHAVDGEAGALRDLVIEPSAWMVRYLVVGADAWAPDHEVLLAPRSLGDIDEQRREVSTELSVDQLRSSPALAAGRPIVRGFEENWYRHFGWEQYWNAEIDVETAPEPPVPPAPPAEEPLASDTNPESPGLVRLENLRNWEAMTTDRVPLPVVDVLFDDADWTVDYLEVAIDNQPGRERCLVDGDYLVGADAGQERLYLAVDSEDLRHAPRRPHPGVGEHCEVRTLESPA